MRKICLKIMVNTISVFIVAWMLSGIHLENSFTAIAVAIALAICNSFLRPLLIMLTIPLTLLSMGLFVLFINAAIVLLAGELVSGFTVDSFGSAFWFSILMSVVSAILELPEKIRQNQIVFKRIIHPNDDPFFTEKSQESNDSQDFQDAEIVDEEANEDETPKR